MPPIQHPDPATSVPERLHLSSTHHARQCPTRSGKRASRHALDPAVCAERLAECVPQSSELLAQLAQAFAGMSAAERTALMKKVRAACFCCAVRG
jgi:hypothetical protein